MSLDTLAQIEYWHWLVGALLLVGLELLAPGAIFVWLAAAAGAVGILTLLLPLPWQLQFLLFTAFCFVSVVLWFRYRRRPPAETTHPTLNQRGAAFIGRTFTLTEPIVNGVGKINANDSTWKVRGPDAPKGTKVTVTGFEGTVLEVDLSG